MEAALKSLEEAARNGEVMALWKLGRMYADGDFVKQNDLRAFEYFRTLADSHADEAPCTKPAVFVASAFVALGGYYLAGIPDLNIKPNAVRAHEMFNYAASYFGDPEAQYRLGRMYLDGQGIARDAKQAVRWLSLAAGKGQYQAQAVFGALLFKGESVPRDAARGLMWLMLARDAAAVKESWITDLYTAALKQATADEQAVALVHRQRWTARSRSGCREQLTKCALTCFGRDVALSIDRRSRINVEFTVGPAHRVRPEPAAPFRLRHFAHASNHVDSVWQLVAARFGPWKVLLEDLPA
jgi:hypothetical protein